MILSQQCAALAEVLHYLDSIESTKILDSIAQHGASAVASYLQSKLTTGRVPLLDAVCEGLELDRRGDLAAKIAKSIEQLICDWQLFGNDWHAVIKKSHDGFVSATESQQWRLVCHYFHRERMPGPPGPEFYMYGVDVFCDLREQTAEVARLCRVLAQTVSENQPQIEWSEFRSVAEWCRLLDIAKSTFQRRRESGQYRENPASGRQNVSIAKDDLPDSAK